MCGGSLKKKNVIVVTCCFVVGKEMVVLVVVAVFVRERWELNSPALVTGRKIETQWLL